MVIDLLFVGLLLACTALLVSGKPLNIHITHTHKIDNESQPIPTEQDAEQLEVKDVATFIQEYLGVTNEEE